MSDLINRADAITAIKGLYNSLGVCGTKAAVMTLEGVPTASAGWISSEDKLPEQDTPVLGMAKRNPFAPYKLTVVEWVGNGWVNTITDSYMEVIKWMPLPKEDADE